IEDILFFLGVSIASIWMAPPIGLSLWKAVETKYHYWLIGAIAFVVFLSVLYRLIWHRQAAGWAKWRRKLRRAVLETCVVFRFILRSGGTTFLLSALLNVLQWSSRFGVLLALVAALGVEANFLGLFFLQWMVYIAMTLVPTPGASGGAEAAFYLIYQTLLPSSVIGLASAGWRIITYYFILFLGLVFLQFGQIARRYKWQLDVPS
ncbi:MAG: lysylphosphatidylglycerol synthase transmembrane domain-containing protein, partial [Bacteroidota bacterium]